MPNPSESSSSTAPAMEILEDKFAKLPDRLAAEMWISTMENLRELSGPETADFLEKKMGKFRQIISLISSKQNFCDAVKATCRERRLSKGIARKMQKVVNDLKIQNDS